MLLSFFSLSAFGAVSIFRPPIIFAKFFCRVFIQFLQNLNFSTPFKSANSSHQGAVGSASAWQTGDRWLELVLMPYIFSGKNRGA